MHLGGRVSIRPRARRRQVGSKVNVNVILNEYFEYRATKIVPSGRLTTASDSRYKNGIYLYKSVGYERDKRVELGQ